MKRLVGLGMFAAALIGCSQTRDGIRPSEGLPPASLPPGLPPIREQINDAPAPIGPPTAAASRPVRETPFAPGINGRGEIEPPRPPASLVIKDGADRPDASAAVPVGLAATTPRAEPAAPPRSVASPPRSTPDRPEPEAGPGPAPGDDPEVRLASATAAEPVVGRPVGEWAARVDNDIITWNELQLAVSRRMRELDPKGQADAETRAALASNVLDHLIDRSLVIQKARREDLKDPNRWEMISKGAVEYFNQEVLPGLQRQHKAADRYDLERILSDRGESLDERIDAFKLEFVYQWYLGNTVTSRIRVDLPEMRSYYFENRDHEAFHRDAELTWREILVRFSNHPGRDASRAKVDDALARIGRGEPFEAVARALGEGPNADQGGLWTTAPGSYAVPAVNAALAALKPGQASPVIEGPGGFHVVRLESARPAGRMTFEEVQDTIRDVLRERKETELVESYVRELYRGAVVSTVFSEYVPRHLRDDGAGG